MDYVTDIDRRITRELNFPLDLFAAKRVDRELSRPFLESAMVLDIGGASGVDAIPMSSVAKAVVVVDLNLKDLLRGKNVSRTFDRHNVHFVRGTGEKLPFADSSFTLLTCFSALDHFPNMESVNDSLREFRRILTRGGRAVITTPNRLCLPVTALIAVRRHLREVSEVHRFSPKELYFLLDRNHLKPVRYASSFPNEVGLGLMGWLLPSDAKTIIHRKAVQVLASCLFRIIRAMFSSRLLGPRFGIVGISESYNVIDTMTPAAPTQPRKGLRTSLSSEI